MSIEEEPQNKRKKFAKMHYLMKNKKKQFLAVGQRGFLATCNFHEKDCIRECYNLLNHYADELYTTIEVKADTSSNDEKNVDILDEVERLIDEAKEEFDRNKRRFQVMVTGANNCIFIGTTIENPAELAKHIINRIASNGFFACRFLIRLVPIEVVCQANLNDIQSAAGLLFDKHFLKQPSTYAIIINKRYNNNINRQDVIKMLAELVHSKNINNTVDLKQPQKAVVVEVIKGLCCLSVIEDYIQNRKYNLVEIRKLKEVETKQGEQIEGSKLDDEEAESNPLKSENIEEEKQLVKEATMK